MIKRATADLSMIMEHISGSSVGSSSNKKEMFARYRIKDLSLTHAVRCLLLVQRIYKLSTNDISRGIIHNRRIGDTMTPYDLYVVGKIAANLTNEEFLAREYLELALRKYRDGSDRLKEIDEMQLLMRITNLCERMHDYKSAAFYLKEFLIKKPDSDEATAYAMKIVKLFQSHGNSKLSFDDPFHANFERDGKYTRRKEFELISDVCRGKMVKETNKLNCRYVSFAPFTRFKLEEVHTDPYVVLYIDVLSDNEIQSLKIVASAKEKSNFDAVRMASLHDKDYKLAERISQRIEVLISNFFILFGAAALLN